MQTDTRVEYNRFSLRRTDPEIKPIVELCIRHGKEMHDNPGMDWPSKNVLWKMEKHGIVGAPQASAPLAAPAPELMRIDLAYASLKPMAACAMMEKFFWSPHLPPDAQARSMARRTRRHVSTARFKRLVSSGLDTVYSLYMFQI